MAQTRYAVHNALANLYKATGGGWVEIAEKVADANLPNSPPCRRARFSLA